MFKHVFGEKAWSDETDPEDFFCETQIRIADPENSGKEIGKDQMYLAEKADYIIPDETTFDERFEGDPRVITCAQLASGALSPSVSGIVWDRTGTCGDDKLVGAPGAPVLLVSDGDASFQNLVLFGVLFVRSTSCDGPVLASAVDCKLTESTGGDASLKVNAGTAIYGSAIVQGIVDKANGHAKIIYDAKVLGNLSERLREIDVYGLPGSWSDTVRY